MMKRKKIKFFLCSALFLLLLLSINKAHAQRDGWLLYDNIKYVDHITNGGGYTWVLSERQGYTRINNTTDEIRRYNVFNSVIPYSMQQQRYYSFATADQHGGLWMSLSFSELGYFDGEKLSVFTRDDFGLPEDASFIPVSDIFAASDGTMWFSTNTGIVSYDGSDWEFTELSPVPMRLTESQDGTGTILAVANEDPFLIFGAYQGFYKFDGEEWHHYTTDNFEGLPSNRIDNIAEDADGVLWMTTVPENSSNFERIRRYDGESWSSYHATQMGFPQITFGSRRVTAFHLDNNGDVWIALSMAVSGAAKFHDGSWKHYSFENSELFGNDVRSIITGYDGRTLIGSRWNGSVTSDGGVQIVTGDEWETISLTDNGPPSLAIRNITAEIVDEEPDFWLATFHGLTNFDGSNWNTYTPENSDIADSFVDDVLVDDDGKIWAATPMGLSLFDRENDSWSTFTMDNTDNGLPSNRILTLLKDEDGGKWIGTDAGFAYYDGETWNTHIPDPLPNNFRVFKSVIDDNGRYWAGTSHGVHVYDGDSWTVYDHQNTSLSNAWSFWIVNTQFGIMVINMRFLTAVPVLYHFNEDEQDFYRLDDNNSDIATFSVNLVSDFRYNSNLETPTLIIGTPAGLQEMFFDETGYLRQVAAYKDFNTSPQAPLTKTNPYKSGPDETLGDFSGPVSGFNAYFTLNYLGAMMFSRAMQGLLFYQNAAVLFNDHVPNKMTNRYSFDITGPGLYDSGSLVSVEVTGEVTEEKMVVVEEYFGIFDTMTDVDDDLIDPGDMTPLEQHFISLEIREENETSMPFESSVRLLGHLLSRGNKLADIDHLERASIYWRPSAAVPFKKLETEWDGTYLIASIDSTGEFIVAIDDVETSVPDDGEIARGFYLFQNYPNPFNPETTIRFHLPAAIEARLSVFDILGRKVAILKDEFMTAGYHQVQFDASQLASGIYIYRLQANSPAGSGNGVMVQTRKLTVIK